MPWLHWKDICIIKLNHGNFWYLAITKITISNATMLAINGWDAYSAQLLRARLITKHHIQSASFFFFPLPCVPFHEATMQHSYCSTSHPILFDIDVQLGWEMIMQNSFCSRQNMSKIGFAIFLGPVRSFAVFAFSRLFSHVRLSCFSSSFRFLTKASVN